jgi:hypothetical protein
MFVVGRLLATPLSRLMPLWHVTLVDQRDPRQHGTLLDPAPNVMITQ